MMCRLFFKFLLLYVILNLSACSFLKINQDRREVNAAVKIKGSIQHSSALDTAIVVGVFSSTEFKASLIQSTVIYGNATFEFLVPAGKYYLAAFEDLNQDLKLQDNEAAGWFGKPSVLKAKSGENISNIVLQLKPPEKVVKTLPYIYLKAQQQPISIENDANLGRRMNLSSPLLEPSIGKMGMWQPLKFLQNNYHGIFFLQEYDPNKIPVMFVHGIGGTGGILKPVIESLDQDKFQPWIVQYPSGLRLDLISRYISSDINKLRSKFGFGEYAVIAHSMGGLVARSVIEEQLKQTNKLKIPLFVSISTPWNGHKAAAFGIKGAPVTVPVWFDIVPNSPYLKRLQQQIATTPLNHHLLFSYKGSLSFIHSENNDGTVELSSQLAPIVQTNASGIYGYNEGHVSVLANNKLQDKINKLLTKLSTKKDNLDNLYQ